MPITHRVRPPQLVDDPAEPKRRPQRTTARAGNRAALLTLALMMLCTACTSTTTSTDSPESVASVSGSGAISDSPSSADPAQAAIVEATVKDVMASSHLKAVIVRVTVDGKEIITKAYGESMSDVPATV